MRKLIIIFVALTLTSCGPEPDRVLFVTSSEIGIGVDPTIGTANIGYDRNELVIGPAYPETGGVPPVYARIDTGGTVFSPKIRQLYATGEAAVQATAKEPGDIEGTDLYGQRRIMVFGTTTSLGLKVAFTPDQPLPTLNFGYKRKEFSILPLRSEQPTEEDPDLFGSLIASISVNIATTSLAATGLTSTQFIATGEAASHLGKESRKIFIQQATAALGAAVDVGKELAAEPYCLAYANLTAADEAKWANVEAAIGFKMEDFCIADVKTDAELTALATAATAAGIPN